MKAEQKITNWRMHEKCRKEQIAAAEDALQAEIERLKEALRGMCELWDALGKQVPPVLGEQKYIRAKNLLNAPCTNAGSAEENR